MKITRMFSRVETTVTATMAPVNGRRPASIDPWRMFRARSSVLLTLAVCIASAFTAFAVNPYLVQTFEENGRQIDEIIVPGRPPDIKAKIATVPAPNLAAGINTLVSMPAPPTAGYAP